ncbi:MAG: hypothetical protein HY820_32800 [Acidobacteria bacterium]|nr:hypothetical protein [Acidobacteriota bacterium]
MIDNNALKDLNIRLGTTATLVNEFQPQRQYFGVEFGNTPPAPPHLSVLKLPAAIHGTLYATHNNSIFTARTFFQAGSVQPARENNYGLAITAPLWTKAFLTLDGSQQKIRGSVNGNVLIPLPSERTLLATDPAARAILQRFLDAYPDVAPNRTDIDPRALNTNSRQSVNAGRASFRLDQQLGSRDRLIARHALTGQTIDAFQFVAGQNPDTTIKTHQSRLTWQRTWSPNLAGTFTVGFDRARSMLVSEPNAVGPQVQIGTAWTVLGPASNIPLDRIQNRFRYAATVNHRRANHNYTAGGELVRLRFNGREASSNRGNWYFRNDFGRDAITNFRLGVPNRFSTGIGELDRGFRNWEQAWYAGDVWKVASHLTLNYGVRWQPVLGPTEVNRLTETPYNCDCNNLAPLFGFAYKLPRQWGVLRGAYGLHYGELYAATFQQLRWNLPNFQKIEVQGPDFLSPLGNAEIGPNGRSTLFVVPPGLRTPYSHQYNFSWEGALRDGWRLQVGYVGSRTHKLLLMNHLNRAVQPSALPISTNTVTQRRPDARYFEVRNVGNSSRAYYDAARVTLVLPERRGLTVDASYWFSKAIDAGAAYTNTAAGDDALQGYSQSQNLLQADLKGPSAFDQSHAALFRARYALPARRLWGKWVASSIVLAKSGMPFTIISGSDGPGFGNVDGTNGDRPDVVDPSILGRTIGNPDNSTAMLPRSAFRYIPIGQTRGNIGTSTFRRAGIFNWNASLSRGWTFARERELTFRAETVNLTNTPQFAAPNVDLSSPSFGKITNTLNEGRTFAFTLQLKF